MKYVAFKEQVVELVGIIMQQSTVVQTATIAALDVCANVMAEDERGIALDAISMLEAHRDHVEYRAEIFSEIQSELTDVVLRVVARCFAAYPHFIDEYRQGLVWDMHSATCAELGVEFAREANFDGEFWWSYIYIVENPQMHSNPVPAILRCIDICLHQGAIEHLRFPTSFDHFKDDLCEANADLHLAQQLSIEDAQAALDWLKQYNFYLTMSSSEI